MSIVASSINTHAYTINKIFRDVQQEVATHVNM